MFGNREYAVRSRGERGGQCASDIIERVVRAVFIVEGKRARRIVNLFNRIRRFSYRNFGCRFGRTVVFAYYGDGDLASAFLTEGYVAV